MHPLTRNLVIATALLAGGLYAIWPEPRPLPPPTPPSTLPVSALAVPPETVDLAVRRELRGAWVPTVANILWPSRPGLTERAQRDELKLLVNVAAEVGLNALFFQVRPEGDALYRSKHEPWSAFLSGNQGADPGWDPLQTLILLAHDRNVEIHAWLNPYRAASDGGRVRAPHHLSRRRPGATHRYGRLLWMDPGLPEVREQLVDVVRDLAVRYDLDGIHFDDYFYPYPEKAAFPDDTSWKKFGGGHTDRGAWRRNNVNAAVEAVATTCQEARTDLRFGISPFGINRPGQPEGIRGFDQYTGLNADPMHWVDQGWVDYIAPQLYWPSTKEAQAYGRLAEWWGANTQDKSWFFAGNFLSMLGSEPAWSVAEFRLQTQLGRTHGHGHIWYHLGPILEDRKGIRAVLRDDLYAEPAFTPPLRRALGGVVQSPEVAVAPAAIRAHHTDPAPLRAWLLWRDTAEGWRLERAFPAGTDPIPVRPGRLALAALTRQGLESPAVIVEVPPLPDAASP